ncbi:Uncharacterised protein [Vibrio cholerae]|uniref:Uncharacterized protein n=1 Tax=Vibrio cholerae TaxID=666 RepID=A0A655YL76_VIBCL|nr:Uncharacterised protein [Vibrio cholerae]CSB61536.1 Uncharacterised protein [Vibrio cholerae]CSB76034.1 Uncharacterised protein [Vibrio cholerae]CSC10597.1 Uncharacterised protein [Vibrio cholerae]CSC29857.1 Uncharacterised protein [Vibrio cholerae]
MTQERSPRTLFTAKTKATRVESINKPFEAYWNFTQFAAKIGNHFINHRTGNQRFTDGNMARPTLTMTVQIINAHREEVIRIHQAFRGHNAVTVVVRIVTKSQVVFIFQGQQTRHGIWRRAIHTDHAIFI